MMGRFPTAAEAMRRPFDNFGVLRLVLAMAVVVSHAGSVRTGQLADEPLLASTGFTLGEHAVNGFFAISGFLVTMSFLKRGWRDYVMSRALRITPAFAVVVLAVAFVLGPAFTALPLGAYLRDPELWRFVSATLIGFKSTAPLPGVFADHPIRSLVGTVWTLKYEVICYAGVLVLGLAGLLRSRIVAALLVAGLALALFALGAVRSDLPKGWETALRLPLLFSAGGALYLWRDRVRLTPWPVLAGLALVWLAAGSAAYRPVLFLFEAYTILWLALAPGLSHPVLDWKTDLSYGTYLLGWPVQQMLFTLAPSLGQGPMLALAVAATLALAALSWFAVERPALALKSRLVRRPVTAPDAVAP